MSVRPRHKSAFALVLVLVLVGATAQAAGNAPGAYCPFPEKGQKPQCLTGAEERYSAFYQGLEQGKVESVDTARIEADLAAGGDTRKTFEALSSLAYGYYVLARRAAESPKADPQLVAKLERWNDLLADAYRETPPDGRVAVAVRAAAQDLHQRAAPVDVACTGPDGRPARCSSTEQLLQEMDARDHAGVRGQLGRLVEQVFGGDGR